MRRYVICAAVLCGLLAGSMGITPAKAASHTAWVGFYVPGCPQDTVPLSAVESKAGTSSAVVNFFQNTSGGFPLTQATNAADHGSIPMITLEFWDPSNGTDQPGYRLSAVSNGAYDDYLHKYAASARSFGRTVWLRPFHEMNGDWYPWGGTVNGNSPGDFAAAWRHVKDVFAAEGATNVKFVWCPNADSVPNTSANVIGRYWPGEQYVDYIGLDGYNWGGTNWRSFSDVFGSAYSAVTALSPDKPVIIAETSTSETGGNKPAWIADMFNVIPVRFPRVIGVTWFDANKEHDWRIECHPECSAAFAAGVAKWSTGAPTPPPPSGKQATSIGISTSTSRARYYSPFVLSGTLQPGAYHDPCGVEVRKPGTSRWSYSSARLTYDTRASWWYRYLPKSRGTYYFRVRFTGDGSRYGSLSGTVAVSVR